LDEEATQIDTTTPSVQKKYKGNFASLNDEEYGCPYASCGRKFVSADLLKQHIERRHAPNIQTNNKHLKPKTYQEDKDKKLGFAEERKRTGFQAMPRPVTSHGRGP